MQTTTTGTWFTLIDSFGRGWQFAWAEAGDLSLSYRLAHQLAGSPDPWTPVRWASDGTPARARSLKSARLSAAAWLLAMDELAARGPDYIGPRPRLATTT